jgi:hypothetical protein
MMIHWRFKVAAFLSALLSLTQLGFSLIFVTSVSPQPLITFAFTICSTLSLVLICASHNYSKGANMYVERIGLCVYHMLAAVKLVMFGSDALCASCHTAAVTRLCLALLENLLSNVVYAHLWRRTEEEVFNSYGWEDDAAMVARPPVDRNARTHYDIDANDDADVQSIDDASTQTAVGKCD